jgi:peptide/nickel transport system permease protein
MTSNRLWSKITLRCAVAVLLLLVVLGIFAPWIAPHGYDQQNLANYLKPPFWERGGSLSYPLGTDELGRDIVSRLIYGARPTLIIIAVSSMIGGGVGGLLGIIAGYRGGWVDVVVARAVDASIAFPVFLFALLLAVSLGPGLLTEIIAVSLVIWSRFARVLRDEVLTLRNREWVLQSKVDGCSMMRTVRRHVIPHVASTWLVLLTINLAQIILLDAALSFLGAGVPPPLPTWGGMAAEGDELLGSAWWVSVMPAVAIMVVVLATTVLSDGLRDRLDPRREVYLNMTGLRMSANP